MKKIAIVLSMVSLFLVIPEISNACCGGDWYWCESWREQVIEDADDNCGGCYYGEVEWIEGC